MLGNVPEKLRWRMRPWILARPLVGTAPSGPLVVAGLFRSASGIGQSARACFAALQQQGEQPVAVDLTGPLLQPEDLPACASYAQMPRDPSGTLILHVNGPETERALFKLGLVRPRSWRVIGYWAWELPVGPTSWAHAATWLSEVWTPSRFAMAAIASISPVPVRTVPHYVDPDPVHDTMAEQPSGLDVSDSDFVVLVMADGRSSLRRKNVADAVSAFKSAFPDRTDVRLVLKCRNLEEFPAEAARIAGRIGADKRVLLIDGTLSAGEIAWLQQRCDVLLSLHRSEGFGLPLAECMARGKPVIATGWSGNVDFMTDETSILLPYRLVPVEDSLPAYGEASSAVWAEADPEAAAIALRELADNPDRRSEIGLRAREAIRKHASSAAWRDALQADAVER